MAKNGRRRKTIDPFLVFVNARSFQLAATVIDAQPQKDFFLWPTIVTESFSLELHIKCLHRLRRRNLWGHDVRELFYKLSKRDQRQTAKYLQEVVSQHPLYSQATSEGIHLDVDSILMRASNMFMRARYWHELEMPNRDSYGHATTAGIGPLSDAVMQLILDLRPDWREKIKTVKFKFPGNTRLSTSPTH
jgi:hypothetical protein